MQINGVTNGKVVLHFYNLVHVLLRQKPVMGFNLLFSKLHGFPLVYLAVQNLGATFNLSEVVGNFSF